MYDINVQMKEDLFIKIKHHHSKEQSIPILRFMLHPSFLT